MGWLVELVDCCWVISMLMVVISRLMVVVALLVSEKLSVGNNKKVVFNMFRVALLVLSV